MFRSRWLRRFLAPGIWMIPLIAGPVWAGPHALVPITRPYFTLDMASPSVAPSGPFLAASILSAPGPTTAYPATGLGLTANDELDEFSFNRADVVPGDQFVLLFNVDRITMGARGPDPSMLPNRPFNVMDQAARHQAAGDTFMTLDGYTRSGGPLLRVAVRNNTLVVNQGDSGGIDDDIEPDASPLIIYPPGTPLDGIDGMGSVPPGPLMTDGPNIGVYFTLKNGSPSLVHLPGTPSGANVYFDPQPNIGGTEQLYVPFGQLGLQLNDDIDGLIVFDSGVIGVFDTGIDQVIFSLRPNSPTLIMNGLSPADIFSSHGAGVFNLFAQANDLGLIPSDNVTGLELLKTTDPATTAFNSAIYYVLPDDYDGDGLLTPIDCAHFSECYSGAGVPDSGPPCDVFDQDADGDVDCRDWINFQLIYRQQDGGASCPLLSVPEFVAALLGTPLQPAHTCMADINLDGKTDGKDVGPYVRTYIGP
ncbi:MAG TPA: hypothetical protein VMV81_07325 [Phycisphaerae bacterium]|nr:hypothetical protein [Phycisphaerae bacterium]